MNLSNYIQLPRKERQKHLDLDTPCLTEKGHWRSRSQRSRKALLALLGVEDDVPNWITAKVQLCHSCECDSHKGWCENPLHLSLGTASENTSDIPLNVQQERGRRAAEATRKEIQVTRIDTNETTVYESLTSAVRELKLSHSALSNVCLGRRKSHKGYTARYL